MESQIERLEQRLLEEREAAPRTVRLTILFDRLERVPWTRVLAGEAEVEELPAGGGTREEQRSREAAQKERRGQQ
jgi:hypothetical protein